MNEAFAADGEPRPLYRGLLDELATRELEELGASVQSGAEERGLSFNLDGAEQPFVVDPVPRLIAAAEWEELERGLEQRHRALNLLLADVYSGERRIVTDGVIPARVIETTELLEPGLVGIEPPPVAQLAGFDLVRGPGGELEVLEDNVRSPSGVAYAIAIAEVVRERLLEPAAVNDIAAAPALLAESLQAAAPEGLEEAEIVVLTDGLGAGAHFEHRELARLTGATLATPAALERSGDELAIRGEDGRPRQVGVVYRRTDEDRLAGPDGEPTELGELLMPAIRAGRLACANSFGTGLADDKLVHAYVDDAIRFYLDAEPLIASVPSYDLGDPGQLDEALERLDEIVVKPRAGLGGRGVVLVGEADATERERIAAELRASPETYVAQRLTPLSTHPTVVGPALEPRHVDLRPYALAINERIEISPAPLTRFARPAGSMIVNSSRSGGGKDTRVVA